MSGLPSCAFIDSDAQEISINESCGKISATTVYDVELIGTLTTGEQARTSFTVTLDCSSLLLNPSFI